MALKKDKVHIQSFHCNCWPGEVPDNAPNVEHEEPIERLLVAYDVKAGVYGVPCREQHRFCLSMALCIFLMLIRMIRSCIRSVGHP